MLHRIPFWFQQIFPGYTWSIATKNKEIYLTFDDGPVPDVTEWVLSVLDSFDIKSTFFLVGENIERHPSIFKKIIADGHSVGNHTYHHLKGWGATTQSYLEDVEKCSQIIEANTGSVPTLFRPPHGRIKPLQAKALRNDYQLIMWNTLTVDYDRGLAKERCLHNSIKATQPGSIVVFHDSVKAEKNLKYVLPKYIEHFLSEGYSFKALI